MYRWRECQLICVAAWCVMLCAALTAEDTTRAQYETFPYPPVKEEHGQELASSLASALNFDFHPNLVVLSPSHLAEINHYLFRGKRDFCKPFRVLVAGGGTGYRTFILASQLADLGCTECEIVHLDLSVSSINHTKRRVASRKKNEKVRVRYVQGSIMNVSEYNLGLFDYIDCLGVLHHMPDPSAGLQRLVAQLRPGGGAGIMLYGTAGRYGVYEFRKLLRLLEPPGRPFPKAEFRERIELTRQLLSELPQGNFLKRDPWWWQQLQKYLTSVGDTGLVDLFLNYIDTPFTVTDIFRLVEESGASFVSFTPPAVYDYRSYVKTPTVLDRLAQVPPAQQYQFAETLAGNLDAHVFYITKPQYTHTEGADAQSASTGDSVCQPLTASDVPQMTSPVPMPIAYPDWDMIPIPTGFNPQELAEQFKAQADAAGEPVSAEDTHTSEPVDPQTGKRRFTLEWTHNANKFHFSDFPALSGRILRHLDGRKTLQQLYQKVRLDVSTTRIEFMSSFAAMLQVLAGVNRLYLSSTPVSRGSLKAISNYFDHTTQQESTRNLYNFYSFRRCQNAS